MVLSETREVKKYLAQLESTSLIHNSLKELLKLIRTDMVIGEHWKTNDVFHKSNDRLSSREKERKMLDSHWLITRFTIILIDALAATFPVISLLRRCAVASEECDSLDRPFNK